MAGDFGARIADLISQIELRGDAADGDGDHPSHGARPPFAAGGGAPGRPALPAIADAARALEARGLNVQSEGAAPRPLGRLAEQQPLRPARLTDPQAELSDAKEGGVDGSVDSGDTPSVKNATREASPTVGAAFPFPAPPTMEAVGSGQTMFPLPGVVGAATSQSPQRPADGEAVDAREVPEATGCGDGGVGGFAGQGAGAPAPIPGAN